MTINTTNIYKTFKVLSYNKLHTQNTNGLMEVCRILSASAIDTAVLHQDIDMCCVTKWGISEHG